MRALAFELPATLEAREPPEARGLARDGVALMAASRSEGRIDHARFRDLGDFLAPGDLLVVNTSATFPAAITVRGGDVLHFSGPAPGLEDERWWVVELRGAGGAQPARATPGRLELAGGASVELVAPHLRGRRLWVARVDAGESVIEYLRRHGRPIRYGYVDHDWPLAAYQTTFATTPGSAEMPSAGRPFSPELVTSLLAGGVAFAPVLLHTGVSSPERHEPPCPEYYRVPAASANLVNATRSLGGRIVAVGTTAARALETVADAGGRVTAGAGWTELVITPARGLRVLDGLISGWHEPLASHLALLEAVAGAELLERCYRAALERGYLWHEFGDSHLIMP